MAKTTFSLTRLRGQLALIAKPHQLRPLMLSVFIGMASQFFVTIVILGGVENPASGITISAALTALPFTLVAAVLSFAILWIAKLIQRQFAAAFAPAYYAAFFVTALGLLIVRQFVPAGFAKPDVWFLPINQVTFVIFIALFIFAFHHAIGISTDRLQEENTRANVALEKLERQHLLLIEGQEEVRKELATFLHDAVQSNLVVLGMQMRSAIDDLPLKFQGMGRSFLDEIERVRSVDVRAAIKQLSPDLDGLSVEPALRELVGKYSKVMKITFDLDQVAADAKLPIKLKLGIYRIVEQALLNAAIHGQANLVSVSVASEARSLSLLVINDGQKLSEPFEMGVGLTIIDGWCKALGGSWKLSSSGERTILSAQLNTN